MTCALGSLLETRCFRFFFVVETCGNHIYFWWNCACVHVVKQIVLGSCVCYCLCVPREGCDGWGLQFGFKELIHHDLL